MTSIMALCAFGVNTFAIQNDVKAAYENELQWLAKAGHYSTYSNGNGKLVKRKCTNATDVDYCVYDMNKDGIKELIVKVGCCEADYMFKFYSCSYGNIVSLGEYGGGHSSLYQCDSNGVFVYGGHMGYEFLTRVEKNGNKIKPVSIYNRDLNPLFAKGYSDPWTPPKYRITMYGCYDYSGLY